MASKLYVGGLPFDTTEEQLKETFAKFGTVESAAIIRDKYSDRSRGFGFVEMSAQSEADEAVRTLNGSMMGGRKITVDHAKERTETRGAGGAGGGDRGRGGPRRY